MPKPRRRRLMASRPLLVTQSGRYEMRHNNKFPSVKIPRFMSSVGLQQQQVGDNGARNLARFDVDLHTTTDNFAPNEYREVVNFSGLAVYKGSNIRDKR